MCYSDVGSFSDVVSSSPQQELLSPPVTMTTQSVIRPIPLLPYSTPPTYIDNLPPHLSVPVISPVLLGTHTVKKDVTEMAPTQVLPSFVQHHYKKTWKCYLSYCNVKERIASCNLL